ARMGYRVPRDRADRRAFRLRRDRLGFGRDRADHLLRLHRAVRHRDDHARGPRPTTSL
ncbi:MAG: protein of unknown function DUF1328, partial [uncultured Rubellimicrobium sp.]